MESSIATPGADATGSRTIADMFGLAAEKFGDRPAARFKDGEDWADVSYREAGEIVSEIARGLIDLGLQPGERVAILCSTRAEWAWSSFAISSAGGVVVPIYPTNSASECEWVAGNSEARFAICEDASQVAKLQAVRERLPGLEAIVSIEPGVDGTLSVDDLRARGRGRDAAELAARTRRRRPGRPVHVHLHVGHDRAAEGLRARRTATTAPS